MVQTTPKKVRSKKSQNVTGMVNPAVASLTSLTASEPVRIQVEPVQTLSLTDDSEDRLAAIIFDVYHERVDNNDYYRGPSAESVRYSEHCRSSKISQPGGDTMDWTSNNDIDCVCGYKLSGWPDCGDARRMVFCETCKKWKHHDCEVLPDGEVEEARYLCLACWKWKRSSRKKKVVVLRYKKKKKVVVLRYKKTDRALAQI